MRFIFYDLFVIFISYFYRGDACAFSNFNYTMKMEKVKATLRGFLKLKIHVLQLKIEYYLKAGKYKLKFSYQIVEISIVTLSLERA